MVECGQWLLDNGYSKARDAEVVRKGIGRQLRGERPTYYGFHFEKV